jgi:hypothetical protein
MTAELLAAAAGTVLSLLFSYVPKFSDWYDKLEGNYKRLIMLAALLVTAAGTFGLACTGKFNIAVSCDVDGALGMFELFLAAAIANQAAYKLSPRK